MTATSVSTRKQTMTISMAGRYGRAAAGTVLFVNGLGWAR
jgi:hypothetical protein